MFVDSSTTRLNGKATRATCCASPIAKPARSSTARSPTSPIARRRKWRRSGSRSGTRRTWPGWSRRRPRGRWSWSKVPRWGRFGCCRNWPATSAIVAALGSDRQGKLALWQVIARVLDQGSCLSAVRLAGGHAAGAALGMISFDEDDLYANLDWLAQHQADIETRLFAQRKPASAPDVFLYDVTSTYLEGEQNAFAAFGYNRDRKSGKRQIVIGLLCDADGRPLSIELFAGNTSDVKTFSSQLSKAATRFGAERVTFVGDRGMIKAPQRAELGAADFHYITAITKAQIDGLIAAGVLQMDLFEQTLAEVEGKD